MIQASVISPRPTFPARAQPEPNHCTGRIPPESRRYAAVPFATLAGIIGLRFVRDDVSWLFVLAHALLAATATAIIDAADHPRLGGAGSKERQGEESDEPFHIWESLVWPENKVVVKKNRTELHHFYMRFREQFEIAPTHSACQGKRIKFQSD